MPPKKGKKDVVEDVSVLESRVSLAHCSNHSNPFLHWHATLQKYMRAARFGRVKNDLKMGFVGLPVSVLEWRVSLAHCSNSSSALTIETIQNVGKSTLTNLMAGAFHAEAANYPFCTIDPNMVKAIVPDQKFKYLAATWKPPSVVPAVLTIVDIAGLIKGASEGAGLGNAFLSHIAAVDGIFHLVRAFDSDDIIHVDDSVDPIRDLETIQSELCLKDKETLTKVVEKEKDRIRKEKGMARSSDPPLGETFQSAYEKCCKLIESNTPVQTYEDFSQGEVDIIRDFGLITTKPQIYVVNMSKKNFLRKGNKWLAKISEWVNSHGGGQIIPMSCEWEQEYMDLRDDKEAQKAFIDQCEEEVKAMGLTGPGFAVKSVVPRLIRAGRTALCLQSFYTAGPKEVRAVSG